MFSSTERDTKLSDVTAAVLEQLSVSCAECSSDTISQWSFACIPDSPTFVTYRARIEGSSQTDSGSLVALIQEWVDGGPGIIVTGVLLTADPECVVAVSSLNEGECSKEDPPPSSTSDNTAGIIGGVVAVVIILYPCSEVSSWKYFYQNN